MSYVPRKPIINGLRGGFAQPGSKGRDSQGYYSTRIIEGTRREVEIEAARYDAWGSMWSIESLHGDRARLTAKISSTASNPDTGSKEEPENVWELNPQEIQKDLLEADFPNAGTIGSNPFASSISQRTADAIASIMNVPTPKWQLAVDWGGAYSRVIAGDTIYTFSEGIMSVSGTVTLPSTDYAAAYARYIAIKRGVRSFPMPADIISHTQLVSNRYTVKASYINCGRLISTSSLIALEAVPDELLFDVPTEPAVTQYIQVPNDLKYAWRKVKPSVRRLSNVRWQITQNYEFGLWTVGTYGAVL